MLLNVLIIRPVTLAGGVVSAEDVAIVELDDKPVNSCAGLSRWVEVAVTFVFSARLSFWVDFAAPLVVPGLVFDIGPILSSIVDCRYLIVIRGRWIETNTGI